MVFRPPPGKVPSSGGEAYSLAYFGEELLAGFYPHGRVFAVGRQPAILVGRLVLTEQEVGGDDSPPNAQFEVQALTAFAGQIWAGVFPDGFAWRSADLTTWITRRFFSRHSRLEPEIEYYIPLENTVCKRYAQRGESCEPYEKLQHWAQRIPSFARVPGIGLTVATGNKHGVSYSAERNDTLDTVHEYGRVWAIKYSQSITHRIHWPEEGATVLRFVVGDGEMKLFENGALIDTVALTGNPASGIVIGRGRYGTGSIEIRVVK